MNLYITGFDSFFSRTLRNFATNCSFTEVEKLTDSDSKHMEFIIPDFTENSFIIHSAWNMNERNIDASFKINVEGTKKFFHSLDERMQKRFIFVSSTSAFEGTKSIYGKHKFEVENYILSKGGKILRCGLIVNEQNPFEAGFFADLYNTARKIPIIPNFTGNMKIYEITTGMKLCEYVLELTNSDLKIGEAYSDELYSFNELVKDYMGLKNKILNVHWRIGLFISKVFELLNINFGVSVDSIYSIRSKINRLQ